MMDAQYELALSSKAVTISKSHILKMALQLALSNFDYQNLKASVYIPGVI